MSYNFTSYFQILKKIINLLTYYYFVVDLYLIEYFSRKYPYCVFIFCYFYGTFGYTDGLSDLHFVCKILCLVFSWYLVYISILVFCVFNIPSTKKYLYNLLGKDFVISKIGNPGIDGATRFGGFAVLGLGVNECGRLLEGYETVKNANEALAAQLAAIEGSHYLTTKEKAAATLEAINSHQQTVRRPPQGTFDRIAKIDAYKDMIARTAKAFTSIWGK